MIKNYEETSCSSLSHRIKIMNCSKLPAWRSKGRRISRATTPPSSSIPGTCTSRGSLKDNKKIRRNTMQPTHSKHLMSSTNCNKVLS